jgi:transcriptional regulator with PAS, ATPase and Fis domain
LGKSDAIKVVRNFADRVGPCEASILILGESGTGKELVARAIHQSSLRRCKPFVAVNCAAFTESLIESELFGHEKGAFTGALRERPGCFERAHGGTLFLDEIGELPIAIQAKLLRTIQEREIERIGAARPLQVDVRIVSATNRNLAKGIDQGWFRQDLYYRINVISITIPPLRKRRSDIPILVNHFLARHTPTHRTNPPTLSRRCSKALENYHYPGNVRELGNIIHRAMILSDACRISIADLPAEVKQRNDEIRPMEVEIDAGRKALTTALQKAVVYTKEGKQALWHRQLRCVKIDAIVQILLALDQIWFSRKTFARFLEAHSADNRNKYKTAGVYLNILRANQICIHNGKKANRSAYQLNNRYLFTPSENRNHCGLCDSNGCTDSLHGKCSIFRRQRGPEK